MPLISNDEFKITLVGDPKTGKTQLVNRFIENQFMPDPASTIAVDAKQKEINIEGKVIKLKIWDTAGQEKFRSKTETFYKQANALILAVKLKSRTTVNQIKHIKSAYKKYITDQQKHINSNSSIILTLTQCDNKKLAYDPQALIKELQTKQTQIKVNAIIITSAKDNKNVEELFRQAVNLAFTERNVINNCQNNSTKNRFIDYSVKMAGSKPKPMRIAFFYSWGREKIILLLLFALILADIGVPLLLTGISFFAASLLLSTAIAVGANLIALKSPKNPYYKLAMLIGINAGVFASAAIGFYLSLYFSFFFPAINLTFGLLFGAVAGAIVGPLFSTSIAYILNKFCLADPQGIKIAAYSTPLGIIVGLSISIGLCFAIPLSLLLPVTLAGAAIGAVISAIIGGVIGCYSNSIDLAKGNKLAIEFIEELSVTGETNKQKLADDLKKIHPELFALPAAQRIVNVQAHHKNSETCQTLYVHLVNTDAKLEILTLKP